MTETIRLAHLVAGLLFPASLLAHELSQVARRNGVEVEVIVLWMLGGVANLDGRARTAGAELRISGVGRLVGGFLAIVTSAEEKQLQVEHALGEVRVRDVMTAERTAEPAALTVAEFLEDSVFPRRFSSFPLVTHDSRPVGRVTLNRVEQVPPDQRSHVTVHDIACSDGRAVVVEHGRVVGILSPSDISRQLQVLDLRGRRDAPGVRRPGS